MTQPVVSSALYKRLLDNTDSITRPAIIEEGTQWSYPQLKEKVNRLADSLSKQGVQAGDRVAIMLMNQKEFVVSLLAIRLLGAVVLPLNVQMSPDDIGFVIQHSGARLIITNQQFSTQFASLFQALPISLLVVGISEGQQFSSWQDAVEQGNPSFLGPFSRASLEYPELDVLIYTSGTTGRPKGVMLSERNLIANLEGIAPVVGLHQDDKILLALPLFHAYGLMIGLYILDCQGTMVLVPNFSPKKILEALVSQNITALPLVPTMFGVLLAAMQKMEASSFKSLRMCISGGASLPSELLKKVESVLDVVVLEGYGMTETSPVLCVNNPKRGSIAGSVGKPLPNVTLKIIDGEIRVKGDNVMVGYYKNPEATQDAFDEAGFLKTGDLGHLDSEGNVFISGGRIKDLIIKAGENISPLQIEQILYQHPAVQDASVIGVPDPKLGEDILACVQLKPEQAEGKDQKKIEQELKKHCQQASTAFLTPAYFRFYDELPKNATGKILKKILREQNPTIPLKTAV